MRFLLQNSTGQNGIAIGEASEENNIKFRAGISLLVVWCIAVTVCVFFYFFSVNTAFTHSNKNLIDDQQPLPVNEWQTNQQPEQNDAFVFVNINKKFFLTRFPSGSQDEKSFLGNRENSNVVAASLKEEPTVIRKAKSGNKNSYTDFTIKRVPQ